MARQPTERRGPKQILRILLLYFRAKLAARAINSRWRRWSTT